jgi:hypothetical protein
VTKDGKTVVATFAKNVLQDEKGATLFTVGADGKVTPEVGSSSWTFDDKDQLLADGKVVLSIADDGAITVTGAKPEKAPLKFEKLPARSKRAATLLVLMMFMTGEPVATPPAAASAATTPPTPPKKK